MPWRGPDYQGDFPSLGYQILEWAADHLVVPSGPLAGQPLLLTDEQARIVIRWYGLDPVSGEFRYRRGSVRRPKGWGKSPMLAALAIAELAGPTVFAGWDAAGEPVGRPEGTPWVQIAATSEDQTDNTYAAVYSMLSQGSSADDLGVDLGITRLYLKDVPGARLEPVTARAGSREGQPITFAVLDESHLWTPRNGGVGLAATLRRNAGKMNRRTFESTNAFRPGDRSVAEATHKAANKGQRGLLYDAVEGPWVDDLSDRSKLMPALVEAYGDSTAWVNLERLYEEANDADTTPADARRFYLNQIVASQDAFVALPSWESAEAGSRAPSKGRIVTLGFDGSRFHDATALIGCDVKSGRLFTLGVWTCPDDVDGWEVPRDEVHDKVAQAFDRWTVARMYCDPPDWDADIADWLSKYGSAVMAFPTNRNSRMSPALKAFAQALKSDELRHDGDEVLADHVTNARLRVDIPPGAEDDPDRHVWKIRKPSPNEKIDAAVAAVLAWQARIDAIASGATAGTSDRRVWTF